MTENLNRIAVEDGDREHYEERIAMMNEDWWREDWLILLGATGHPEAKPIVLAFIDDPNRQVRRGAIIGLGGFDDRDATDRLMALLADRATMTPALEAIAIRADRRARRAEIADAVLEAVARPTLVHTKRVWMDTAESLGLTDRVRPILARWAESPHAELRAAARDRIARLAPQ